MKKIKVLLNSAFAATALSIGAAAGLATTNGSDSSLQNANALLNGMEIGPVASGQELVASAQKAILKNFNFTEINSLSDILNVSAQVIDKGNTYEITNSSVKYDMNKGNVKVSVSLKNADPKFSTDQQLLVNDGYHLGASYTSVVTIDLQNLTEIMAPEAISVIRAESVTYNEVNIAIQTNVDKAVKELVETATDSDYSYRIYSDKAGDAYQNLDLSTSTQSVYVKVTASAGSTILTGATDFIEVTLPIATSSQYDLQNLNVVEAPKQVPAQSPWSVTYSEIQLSLQDNVLAAIQAVSPTATDKDYTFAIYADDKGTELNNINLYGRGYDVYVKIDAATDSLILKGTTAYIKVSLPPIQFSLVNVSGLEQTNYKVTGADQSKITSEEIRKSLDDSVVKTVQTYVPTAQLNSDYTYEIYDSMNYSPVETVNLMNQTAGVWIHISSGADSKLLKDSSDFMIVLEGTTLDISKVDSIASPEKVIAQDITSVTLDEAHEALTTPVLDALRKIEPKLTKDDFTFTIASDSKGSAYKNVNLQGATADVWVQISATPGSVFISGKTGYIQVTLPALKHDLTLINNLGPHLNYITSADVKSVTLEEFKKALNPVIQSAINEIAPSAALNTDYNYYLSGDSKGTRFTTLDLSKASAANARTIYVRINAVPASTILENGTSWLAISVFGTKIDISRINRIPVSQKIAAANPKAVTETEIRAMLDGQVLNMVRAIAPMVSETDYTYTLYNNDQTKFNTINLSRRLGFIRVVINASETSQYLMGTTQYIAITLPPIIG